MARKYTKIKELEREVFQMKEEGKTNREKGECQKEFTFSQRV